MYAARALVFRRPLLLPSVEYLLVVMFKAKREDARELYLTSRPRVIRARRDCAPRRLRCP